MSRKEKEFFQGGPQLGNQYDDDLVLRDYLAHVLEENNDVLRVIEPSLVRLGERTIHEILPLGNAAEASPPRHIPYDSWGKRIDTIEMSPAWNELGRIATEEGLVRRAYEQTYGALSRIDQFARVYLFSSSSALYTCPLAMSDGAARMLTLYRLYDNQTWQRDMLSKLLSSNPSEVWTSGQWMTEREGGSDVGRTATIAIPQKGSYRLYGTKWFTSAITAPMAMTLARVKDALDGNRGLSLFALPLRDAKGNLNHIVIHRLKDKLGTKALPTAELAMNGTRAMLVGSENDGVKNIAAMLNITRVWNTVEAISLMRRGIALARDYAFRREAFGATLAEKPAHCETLAAIETEFRGAFALGFRVIELLGRDEVSIATEEESALLRLLTPIAKLYTAKQAISVMSEVMECFGGAGYVEDTGLPRLLRNAHVLSTWEGTTNVLALDVLRVLKKPIALTALENDIERRLGEIHAVESRELLPVIRGALRQLMLHCKALRDATDQLNEGEARRIAFCIARVSTASLLLGEADWAIANGRGRHALIAAKRWCEIPLLSASSTSHEDVRLLAHGGR